MDAGIEIAQCMLDGFATVKTKKAKYIVGKISDDKRSIVLENVGTSDDYEEFLNGMPEDSCRFAIYDYEGTRSDGVQIAKMQAILWAPESLKSKDRFVYAAAMQVLCDRTIGGTRFIQATETADLEKEMIIERLIK